MSTSPTPRSSLETDSLLSRETVTATASTQEKLDWLLGLPSGATHIANYKTDDFSSIVRGVTNNRGVDLIVDFVGQSHWEKNIDSLAIDGHMVMLALLSGERDHLLAVIDADGTDHKVGFSFFFLFFPRTHCFIRQFGSYFIQAVTHTRFYFTLTKLGLPSQVNFKVGMG